MKLAPVDQALRGLVGDRIRLVHTGQHYDHGMSEVFFSELGIPEPDVNLEVGSGTHGAQTARILERYERHILEERPAATVVFGDRPFQSFNINQGQSRYRPDAYSP
jgi:UDP-N-acetylglucosamine 2-epimerase